MPRFIIRIAVYLLGEKRVASYVAERYGTEGYDDISRSVGRLCSVLNVPYMPNKRETAARYAHEIRQNIDVCIGMLLCGKDMSYLLGRQWTSEEIEAIKRAERRRNNDTASLRDSFRNAPHSCYNREHDNGEKARPDGSEV